MYSSEADLWPFHTEDKTTTTMAASSLLCNNFDYVNIMAYGIDTCDDGCPNQHYSWAVSRDDHGWGVIQLQGHPLVCFNDGECHSQLRILRAASIHYSVLRTLLYHVYTARRSHLCVVSIDKALSAGDFHSLMEITKVQDFADLLSVDLDSSYQQSADDAVTLSVPQSLHTQLLIKHAHICNYRNCFLPTSHMQTSNCTSTIPISGNVQAPSSSR